MKFKIFDKEKKEFVKDSAYYLDSDGDLFFNNEIGQDLYDFIYAPDKFIPIFSTTQKDIDGNEIYEGDVVEAVGKFGELKFTNGTIIKNHHFTPMEKLWSNHLVKYNDCYAGYEPFCFYDCDCDAYNSSDEFKIIGSIYTNPELLEKTK